MKRQPRLTKREQKAARPVPEAERYTITMSGRELTVPYVAAWSSEMPDFRVAPEPLLGGMPALFRRTGRRGEGKPVLGQMDVGRQGLCMLRGLCQVCAEPIEGPVWHALLEEPAELLNGRIEYAVREPAACTRCMAISLAVCPGLQRARPAIVEVAAATTLVTRTTPPIGGVGPLLPDGPELDNPKLEESVAGYLKIVVHGWHALFSPSEFVERFAPR